jgi:hypothetical protein
MQLANPAEQRLVDCRRKPQSRSGVNHDRQPVNGFYGGILRIYDSTRTESQLCAGLVDTEMALNLAASQHHLIRDMILDRTLTTTQIATNAGCSERSIKAIKSNLAHFNSTRAPANGVGRRRSITPLMLGALCEHLLEKPGVY